MTIRPRPIGRTAPSYFQRIPSGSNAAEPAALARQRAKCAIPTPIAAYTRAMPAVSVVLAVYNGDEHLAQAIESVLSQTYEDLELIIVDDGSTDRSPQIVASFTDSRIRVLSQSNSGLSAALNVGTRAALGRYIARHDADDVSQPHRIARQVAYLDANPDIAMVGSNFHVIDGTGKIVGTTDVFTDPADLDAAEVVSNQFGHGAVMLRASALAAAGGYDERYTSACDVDLWNRIARSHKVANLPEPLYLWRNEGKGLSTTSDGVAISAAEVSELRRRDFEFLLRDRKRLIRSLGLRPRSTRGGVKRYFAMKNRMYRGLALLAAYSGRRRLAIVFLMVAAAHGPWIKRTYRQFVVTTAKPSEIAAFPYDPISL